MVGKIKIVVEEPAQAFDPTLEEGHTPPCPHDRCRDVETCPICEAEEERDEARAEIARLEAIQRDLALYRDAAEQERDALRELVRECREVMLPLAGCSDPVQREEVRPLLQRIDAKVGEGRSGMRDEG